MKVVVEDFEVKVYCYHCGDCEERFYLEELVDNSEEDVVCPYCGEIEYVAISSGHLDELNNK